MDRCPNCRGPLTFEGISLKPVWARWASCALCSTWVVSNETGRILRVDATPPAKGSFLTGKALGS